MLGEYCPLQCVLIYSLLSQYNCGIMVVQFMESINGSDFPVVKLSTKDTTESTRGCTSVTVLIEHNLAQNIFEIDTGSDQVIGIEMTFLKILIVFGTSADY